MESGILFCDPDYRWHWVPFKMLLFTSIYVWFPLRADWAWSQRSEFKSCPWYFLTVPGLWISMPTASSAVNRIKMPGLFASVTKIDWLLPGHSSRANLLRPMQLYQAESDRRSRITRSDRKQGLHYLNLTIHNYGELLNSPCKTLVVYGTSSKISRESISKRKMKVKWKRVRTNWNPLTMIWNQRG